MARLFCPLLLSVLLGLRSIAAFHVVGWIVNPATVDWDNFPWHAYTILRFGSVVVNSSGHASSCSPDVQGLIAKVHSHGLKVQLSPGDLNVWGVLSDPSYAQFRKNYLDTVGAAVIACGGDGIEFDYECPPTRLGKVGIVSAEEARNFTELLRDVKVALGGGRLVSCDVGSMGLTEGSYPLSWRPWVDVGMLNAGAFDFVNTMSYHHAASGSIAQWKKDGFVAEHVWGMDRSRVNLGIGYYSFQYGGLNPFKITREPTWGGSLSPLCPNAAPDLNVCNGTTFVGKAMNEAIGAWVREKGFGGVFPWAADYDSLDPALNNTLVEWLARGLRGSSSPQAGITRDDVTFV